IDLDHFRLHGIDDRHEEGRWFLADLPAYQVVLATQGKGPGRGPQTAANEETGHQPAGDDHGFPFCPSADHTHVLSNGETRFFPGSSLPFPAHPFQAVLGTRFAVRLGRARTSTVCRALAPRVPSDSRSESAPLSGETGPLIL